MSEAVVKIQGIKELDELFKMLPDKLSRNIQLKALRKSGGILVTAARRILRNKTKGTGDLARSIGIAVHPDKSKAAIWVGPRHLAGVGAHSMEFSPMAVKKTRGSIARAKAGRLAGWRAHFIEFGTVKQPAKPFMRPAYDEKVNEIKNSIADNLGKVVNKELEKAAAKLQKYRV